LYLVSSGQVCDHNFSNIDWQHVGSNHRLTLTIVNQNNETATGADVALLDEGEAVFLCGVVIQPLAVSTR